jgi:hypothetical protein
MAPWVSRCDFSHTEKGFYSRSWESKKHACAMSSRIVPLSIARGGCNFLSLCPPSLEGVFHPSDVPFSRGGFLAIVQQ